METLRYWLIPLTLGLWACGGDQESTPMEGVGGKGDDWNETKGYPCVSDGTREFPYAGYWLKIVKHSSLNAAVWEEKSWEMQVMYQDSLNQAAAKLEKKASLCVRGSDTNTPNGLYIVMGDLATRFGVDGYRDEDFTHNLQFKYALRSWYIHRAPWNTEGKQGCPTKSSGGCLNMREQDFAVLINGGTYTNPFTNAKSSLPGFGVGLPIVVVDSEDTCSSLGECMKAMKCSRDLYQCFRMYTCAMCPNNEGTKWSTVLGAYDQSKHALAPCDGSGKPKP